MATCGDSGSGLPGKAQTALNKRLLVVLSSLALACACSGGGGGGSSGPGGPPPVTPSPPPTMPPPHKISHVIIIVQENRSFNNLFYGYPGAKTATFGFDSTGQKLMLRPVGFEAPWDVEHAADGFLKACNGTGSIPGTNCRMNGFDREIIGCGGSGQPPCPFKYPEYSYVPHSETKPYFDMARQYVLSDEMYASNFDASSFVSHLYIIAGQAESSINYPTTAWGCPGGPSDKVGIVNQQRHYPVGYEVPCWNTNTLGDELDKKGLTWAFYAPPVNSGDGIWSTYQAINHIYNGPDWKQDVFAPPTQFLTDVSGGHLRNVTWVMPTYTNSDHPGSKSTTGPSWVASLVNVVGQSKYWNSTAIFVFWDDYGGMYDSEPPAYADYDGLGLRLPLLIISPYAKTGKVSHVHYEHGSILRFVEDQFGLPRLAASDARAVSPEDDSFDFTQSPRKFVPISAPYTMNYFMRQPIDYRPPDSE
jgi:phospholipase C